MYIFYREEIKYFVTKIQIQIAASQNIQKSLILQIITLTDTTTNSTE